MNKTTIHKKLSYKLETCATKYSPVAMLATKSFRYNKDLPPAPPPPPPPAYNPNDSLVSQHQQQMSKRNSRTSLCSEPSSVIYAPASDLGPSTSNCPSVIYAPGEILNFFTVCYGSINILRIENRADYIVGWIRNTGGRIDGR